MGAGPDAGGSIEVSEVDMIAEVFVVQEGGSSEVVVMTRIDEVLF